jgi:hypothetical protein
LSKHQLLLELLVLLLVLLCQGCCCFAEGNVQAGRAAGKEGAQVLQPHSRSWVVRHTVTFSHFVHAQDGIANGMSSGIGLSCMDSATWPPRGLYS